MAIYDKQHGFQSVLGVALGEYHPKGFHLEEDGDHFLCLYYQGKLLDVFSQATASVFTLQDTCREYLESLSAS